MLLYCLLCICGIIGSSLLRLGLLQCREFPILGSWSLFQTRFSSLINTDIKGVKTRHCALNNTWLNSLTVHVAMQWKYQKYARKNIKMNKTYFGHHQYTEAAIFADSAVIWCLISILSQTTSINVAHNITLGVFRSHKTVLHAAESAGGNSGMEAILAILQDLGGPQLNTSGAPISLLKQQKRLTANTAWVLITDDVAKFAARNKKEEGVCRDKIRQTRTRAGCSQISWVTSTWVTKGTNEGSG